MPISSNTYTRAHDWTDDRDASIKIGAERHDENDDDFASALNTILGRLATIEAGTFDFDVTVGASRRLTLGVPFSGQDFQSIVRADQGWQTFDFHDGSVRDWTDGQNDNFLTGRSRSWSRPAVTNQSTHEAFTDVTNEGTVYESDAYAVGYTSSVIHSRFDNADRKRKLYVVRARYRLIQDDGTTSNHRFRVGLTGIGADKAVIGSTTLIDSQSKTVSDGWQELVVYFFSDHQTAACYHRLGITLGGSSVASVERYQFAALQVKEIDYLNAKDFGARAEGTGASANDNYPAFDAMRNLVKNEPGAPNTLYWPGNEYAYKFSTGNMTFSDLEQFALIGDGRFLTQFYFDDDVNDHGIHVQSTVNNTQALSHFTFQGFSVSGYDHLADHAGQYYGMLLEECNFFTVKDVYIRHFARGVGLDADSQIQSPEIGGFITGTWTNVFVDQNYFPNSANQSPVYGVVHLNSQSSSFKPQGQRWISPTIYSNLTGTGIATLNGTGSASDWYEIEFSNGLSGTEGIWVNELVDGVWIYKDHGSGDYTFECGADFDGSADVSVADDTIEISGHGLSVDDEMYFSADGGSLPTGLVDGTTYYVVSPDTDTFKVSTSIGGAAVNITGAGSGTCVAWRPVIADQRSRLGQMPWANGDGAERARIKATVAFASGSNNVKLLKRDPYGAIGYHCPIGSANSMMDGAIGGYEILLQEGDGGNAADENYWHLIYGQICYNIFKVFGSGESRSHMQCDEYAASQVKQALVRNNSGTFINWDQMALPPGMYQNLSADVALDGNLADVAELQVVNHRGGVFHEITGSMTLIAANSGGADIDVEFALQWQVEGQAAFTTLKTWSVRSNPGGATSNDLEQEVAFRYLHDVAQTNTAGVTKEINYRLQARYVAGTSASIKGAGTTESMMLVRAVNP